MRHLQEISLSVKFLSSEGTWVGFSVSHSRWYFRLMSFHTLKFFNHITYIHLLHLKKVFTSKIKVLKLFNCTCLPYYIALCYYYSFPWNLSSPTINLKSFKGAMWPLKSQSQCKNIGSLLRKTKFPQQCLYKLKQTV